MRVSDMLNQATAVATPEQRKDLMNIQSVSRESTETDEEWLERITKILEPLYEEE